MKKFFVIISIILTLLVGFVLLIYLLPTPHPKSSRPTWLRESDIGYAPFQFSAHKGWVSDKRYDYFALRRKLSKDLPESNFNLQIQELVKVTGKRSMPIDEHVDNYLIKELKEIHKAEILSVKNFTVDAFAGKDIVCTNLVTIRGLTREVKSRLVVFIAGEYVYSFTLGSFEKDFDQASLEFERMVGSFHFKFTRSANDSK